MKKPGILLLFNLTFFSVFAQSEFIYSSVSAGESPKNWNSPPTWERDYPGLGWPPNVPGHPATHTNLAEVIINGYVSIYGGGLSVVNANPTITVNDTLYIRGDVALGSGADMIVEDGGILIIDGDLTLSGSFVMGNLGSVVVTGDLNVTNGNVNNSSDFYVYGDTNLTGGGLVNGCGGWSGCSMDDYQIGSEADLLNENESLFDFVDSDGAVLPIVLISFTSEINSNSIIKLNWATAKEEDFSHFEIERSVDGGKNFSKIGVTEGAGQSVSLRSYSYTDRNAPFGKLFYRLSAVDLDGSFEYSPTISITKGLEGLLTAYPNPTESKRIYINVPDAFGDTFQRLEFYNLTGECMMQLTDLRVESEILLPSHIPTGLYLINVVHNGLVENIKILVK